MTMCLQQPQAAAPCTRIALSTVHCVVFPPLLSSLFSLLSSLFSTTSLYLTEPFPQLYDPLLLPKKKTKNKKQKQKKQKNSVCLVGNSRSPHQATAFFSLTQILVVVVCSRVGRVDGGVLVRVHCVYSWIVVVCLCIRERSCLRCRRCRRDG